MFIQFKITQKSFNAIKTVNVGNDADIIKDGVKEIVYFINDLKKLNETNEKYGVKCQRMKMAKSTNTLISLSSTDGEIEPIRLNYKGIGKVFDALDNKSLNEWLNVQFEFIFKNSNVIQ